MTTPTPADITPETLAAIRGDDTPESVAARIDPHALTPAHGAVMIRAGLGREAAAMIRAQAAEIVRLTAKLDACILVKDRAFACATKAEAALATLSAIPEAATSVVATALAGADAGSCGAVVTAYVAMREAMEMALGEMEEMGDTLNGMDAVTHADVARSTLAFEAIRSAISTEGAPPTAQGGEGDGHAE